MINHHFISCLSLLERNRTAACPMQMYMLCIFLPSSFCLHTLSMQTGNGNKRKKRKIKLVADSHASVLIRDRRSFSSFLFSKNMCLVCAHVLALAVSFVSSVSYWCILLLYCHCTFVGLGTGCGIERSGVKCRLRLLAQCAVSLLLNLSAHPLTNLTVNPLLGVSELLCFGCCVDITL